mmetsp:Transcript_17420/g.54167  ORF Transcript_17420/g.54167 Transcript_17420/m.54167 type:complete len:278 (-) Transcript_17420:1488-2321(-)
MCLLGPCRWRGPRGNFSPRPLLHRVVAPTAHSAQMGYPVAEMRVRPRVARRLLLVRGLRRLLLYALVRAVRPRPAGPPGIPRVERLLRRIRLLRDDGRGSRRPVRAAAGLNTVVLVLLPEEAPLALFRSSLPFLRGAAHDDRVVARAAVGLALARPHAKLLVEGPDPRLEGGPEAVVLDLHEAVAREDELPLQRPRREAHREPLRGHNIELGRPRDPFTNPALGQLAVVRLERRRRRGVADGLDLENQPVVLLVPIEHELVGLEAHDEQRAARPHPI